MIFSKEKWNDAAELNQFIPVSAALSFESVQSSLEDAWRLFVLPLLGAPLAEELEAYYHADNLNALQAEALNECQRAVANLSFWYNYTELNVRISDQGMQRQESDGSFKQTYKYQEDQLRLSFRNKGFNALDRLIEIFDKHQADFPLYEQSPAYASRKAAIVRSTADVNREYFINNSHLTFLRLKPLLNLAEEHDLKWCIGDELYEVLKDALKKGIASIGNTTTEELRYRCARFVIPMAIAKLVLQTGSVTDRGLYFAHLNEGDGNVSMSPATLEERKSMERIVLRHAEDCAVALTSFIQSQLPEYFGGRPSSVLTRDNDNKRTVFL